jgi:Flp pilus assembly protein TadD
MGEAARSKTLAVVAAALAWCAAAAPARAGNERSERTPYAVMVFENASGIKSMEWLRAAVPFSIGENLERHPGLRPVYGTLVLPNGDPPAKVDADSVAALAASTGAELVWTGSLERAKNWDLVMSVTLWRVENGTAKEVGELQQQSDFKDVHKLTNTAVEALCKTAGVPIQDEFRARVLRTPTEDYYAFTLFGRGLYWIHGVGHTPHLTEAKKNLTKSAYIDPKMAATHRLLATIYLWKKQPAKARGKFGYALDLDPDYYAALAGQGRVLYEAGKTLAAQDVFEKMLKQRPWDIELRFDLGKLFWENGDVDASLRELERVVDGDPKHIEARRILVLIHASRGKGADLVSELETVAELDPDDLETRLDLGAAYASVERDADAIAVYNGIVENHPEHLQALKFLGDLYRRKGDLKQAIAYYERALDANAKDPRPYFLLGRAYVEAGDDKAARKIYLRALRFKQYAPETYNNIGSILLRQKQYGKARWYLNRAVRKRPDNARFRHNLALVLSVLRELDEAIEHIEAGLAESPDYAALHYLRGVVQLRTGDADGAKASFEKTLELEPGHTDAEHNLSLLEQMRRRAADGEITIELPQPD